MKAETHSEAHAIGSPVRAYSIALDSLHASGARTVLDCPAGEGAFFQQLVRENFAVTAADIAPDNFRLGEFQCDFADLNDRLPYPDASFDAVTCLNGLQRVWARARAVEEMSRVLKPGGTLLISFPNVSDIRRRVLFFLSGSVTWSVIGPPHAFLPGATDPAGCFRYALTLADVLATVSSAGMTCNTIRATHYSAGALALLPLSIMPLIFRWLSPSRYGGVYDREHFAVHRVNSMDGLLGAFLVVVAKKPA